MKFNIQLKSGLQCKNVDAGKNEELGSKFEVPNVAEAQKAINAMIQQKMVTPAIEALAAGRSATVLDMTITPAPEPAQNTGTGATSANGGDQLSKEEAQEIKSLMLNFADGLKAALQ